MPSSTPHFQTILLPTAFSELSRQAAAHAAALARGAERGEAGGAGAVIHVLHVVAEGDLIVPSPTADTGVGVGLPAAGPSTAEMMEISREGLERFANLALKDVAGRVVLASAVGGVVEEIVKYAEANGVDVIVMGTHADGMLKRLIFGSTSKSVLERSPCPVLLVPIENAKKT